ncbi:MAG: DNA mismatch repair endonuclease MutL [Pirellulaceae bacterium]
MPAIKQLPPSVINKIAAGEVIERPASVVKELLENAIDAGSTRIDVSVAKGGLELIRIADDGCGIAPEDLPLAVASHATSKIQDADDLFRVGTLGFRGEALASIAEISQTTMRSRTGDATAGFELEVHGGAVGDVAPCGCPVGTSIEVRNLFYNTPVRRKFMRTTQTEMGHVSEAFTRAALACPRIHFTLRHNDKIVHDLPAAETWRERIATFFGEELSEGLIAIENRDAQVQLSGYVADPQFSRGNNRMQYLFLNGRHIRDRALQHALGEAYRGLLLTGRFPIAFLRLQMPAEAVDVNVHPAKLEVRFVDGGRIYSQMLGTLRSKFLSSDLTARVRFDHGDARPEASAHDTTSARSHRRELVEWAKGQLSPSTSASTSTSTSSATAGETPVEARDTQTERERQAELDLDYARRPPLEITRLDRSWPAAGTVRYAVERATDETESGGMPELPLPATAAWRATHGDATHGDAAHGDAAHRDAAHGDAPNGPAAPPPSRRPTALQVQNRYLITEDESGMVVIDQHALHERILYEHLREKVLEGVVERQRLLVPETVHLTASEAAAALDAREALSRLGIEIEPFGGDTVLMSSYPAMLGRTPPAELLRQVVEQLGTDAAPPDRRDLLDELLHMISCKAAIKAGDRLSMEEIDALIQQRHLCQDSHHCPHGRPTALVFSRDELDRRFKRT